MPPTPRPDQESDAVAKIAAVLEMLATRDLAGDQRDVMAKLTETMEQLVKGQHAANAALGPALKKAMVRENAIAPQRSVFNPRGDKDFPKPALKCKMTYGARPLEPEMLTREETELLNLLEPGEYPIERADGNLVKMQLIAVRKLESSELSELHITHPTAFSRENQKLLPAFSLMLRSLLRANPLTAPQEKLVVTMHEELALIAKGFLNDGTAPENGRAVSIGE
jgi:hypothetical protein